jgi:hypothetical protein
MQIITNANKQKTIYSMIRKISQTWFIRVSMIAHTLMRFWALKTLLSEQFKFYKMILIEFQSSTP